MSTGKQATHRVSKRPRRAVMVFIDGIGWGGVDPEVNPCHSYGGDFFRLPESPSAPVGITTGGWAVPIDAVLGVEGVPQSATGQTTLLTGTNAPRLLGKHLTGFPNEPLRELLLERSILKGLTDRGRVARFLNVFRPLFFDLPKERQLRLSATTVANLAAGNRFFDLEDLRTRRAIYQEFTNEDLRAKGFDVPLFSPAEAGGILAQQAREHDFLLYEYFQTDKAGHAQDPDLARLHLRRLDEFLGALLHELGLDGHVSEENQAPEPSRTTAECLVVLTSDHGNLEDLSTKRHTLNPVPLMAWGPGAEKIVSSARDLTEVTPALLSLFISN